jgi:hypothetical protein
MAPVRPARQEQVNKILCRCVPRPRSWTRVRRSGKAAVERRWRRAHIESKTHTKKRAGAWAIDFVRISQKVPSGRFTRRPLNLNSHNHNQRDRRPCFSLAVLKNRAFPTMLYFPCTQSCGNNTPQTRRHSSRTELGIELQRIRTASAERMTARVIATHRSPCNKDAIGLPSHSRHREYLKVFDRRSNELSRR